MISKIRTPFQVTAKESLHYVRPEQCIVLGCTLRERLDNHGAQRSTQPLMCRNIESTFLRVSTAGGSLPLHQVLEHELLPRPANLQRRWKRSGKFHDAMIEKRRPHFHRMRHAHAIALHQNIVWQIVLLIEIEEWRQVVSVGRQLAHLLQHRIERARKRPRFSNTVF